MKESIAHAVLLVLETNQEEQAKVEKEYWLLEMHTNSTRKYSKRIDISQQMLADIAGICVTTMRTSCKVMWKVQKELVKREKENRETKKKVSD